MTLRTAQLARFTFWSLCAGVVVFSGVCHAYAGYMAAAAERGWKADATPRTYVQPMTTFTPESPTETGANACPMTTQPITTDTQEADAAPTPHVVRAFI